MTTNSKTMTIIIKGKKMIINMTMSMMMMQVMREEGLEQVTGLSCGTGDNQMVSLVMVGQSNNQMVSVALITTL